MFLCHGVHVRLTCNLWVEARFLNGVLEYIEHIFFVPSSKTPQLPQFSIAIFEKYPGVPFDSNCLIFVPITHVVIGNIKHMPLKMAWACTIHK